jgi:hypothetical protein
MKRILILAATIAAMTLSGCAVQKQYGASGGSKADGTIKMSYTYSLFEAPTVNENEALASATKRCKVWGYSSAEAFDFTNKKCQQTDSNGSCNSWIVTKEFQCNG